MNKSIHFRIFGRVQGVSFRYYTREKALELGIIGWVKNCPDGTVEVYAHGGTDEIEEFKAFLGQGSPMAKVARVEPLPVHDNVVPEVQQQAFEIRK